jgi:hypothetical protein
MMSLVVMISLMYLQCFCLSSIRAEAQGLKNFRQKIFSRTVLFHIVCLFVLEVFKPGRDK